MNVRPDPHAIDGKFPTPAEHAEFLVIGGGPAGCAAAIEAARGGLSVMLVDENPIGSGLIGLDVPLLFGGRATAAVQNRERMVEQVLEASPALAEAFEAGVDVRLGTYAWGAWVSGPGLQALPVPVVGLADETRSWTVGFDRLVVAAGARDLVLSFAGSEQPGVVGAQGLHALLARYRAFAGRRLVVLGSGELAVETAKLALDNGVEVAALVEVRDAPEASRERIAELAARGVEIVTGHVPLEARGSPNGVEALVVAPAGDTSGARAIPCDTICLALGTVPSVELLDVLGARLALDPARGGFVPVAGRGGETSTFLDRVFVAGDCAGLGGDAEAQGREAARAVLSSLGKPARSPSPREAAGRVGVGGGSARDVLGVTPPGSETVDGPDKRPAAPAPPTLTLPAASRGEGTAGEGSGYAFDWARALLATGGTDVLACACEEVTRAELLGVHPPRYLGWTAREGQTPRDLAALAAFGPIDQDHIKRLTRACMGPCQARRCREQVAMLLALGAGVPVGTIPLAGYRAPVRPLPLSVLADADETPAMEEGWNVWFGIAAQWVRYDDIGTEREAALLRAGMRY